jgi:hypothetical protein
MVSNFQVTRPDAKELQLIMTPLITVSFILSLVLVERRDRTWRVSEHATARNSIWSGAFLRNWLDPEPYQDPTDSTWQHSENTDTGNQPIAGAVPQPGRNRWFTRKKHRKMAKMQLGDAFEMRGAVMISLIGILLFSVVALGWFVKKAFGFGKQ